MTSASWKVRCLRGVLLLASGAAIATALSPQPMRWFIRGPLFAAGLLIGVAELRRFGIAGGLRPRDDAGSQARSFDRLVQWAWSALVLVFWSKVLALVVRYVGRDALHYFRFEAAEYGPLWPRRMWLIAHIVGGMRALALGPMQFWTGLRGIAMRWHRWTGRGYVLGVLLAGGSAYHLGRFIAPAEGGMTSGISMMILATVWLAATAMAVRAIMHRRIEAHREWMTRSYVLAFAFVNIRWLIELPMLAALGSPRERIPVIIWASWAVPLFVAEAALQCKRVR